MESCKFCKKSINSRIYLYYLLLYQ